MTNLIDTPQKIQDEIVFTQDEIKELEKARKMPITFDEDCPETTPERARRFKRVNPPRGEKNSN